MNDLTRQTDQFRTQLTDDYIAAMNESFERLRQAGVPDSALKVGAVAPDFALPAHDGTLVRLSDKLASGPVVLNFYRGEWCGICRLEMDALRAVRDDIEAVGGAILSISPELPERGRPDYDADLIQLHDQHNGVGLQYGIVYRMPESFQRVHRDRGIDLAELEGNPSWMLPLPATFVVAPNGRIALAFVDIDYFRRLEPAKVRDCVQRVSRSR